MKQINLYELSVRSNDCLSQNAFFNKLGVQNFWLALYSKTHAVLYNNHFYVFYVCVCVCFFLLHSNTNVNYTMNMKTTRLVKILFIKYHVTCL